MTVSMGDERSVRSPVVAGSFYSGSSVRLAAVVDDLLAGVTDLSRPADEEVVRGIVAPHAGYQYSGPVAASAYAFLSAVVPSPSRIVLVGPSHFEPLRGLAVPGHRAWSTPLGDVIIDRDGRGALLATGARIDDAPHRSEHSLEVQLPFLQRCYPDVPVLPVAVGTGQPEIAAEMLAAVLSDDAVLVVSSDLSHYHDAATARRLDARSASAIEALDPEGLGPEDACGFDALRAGMAWARRTGCRIDLLDLRDSSDTAGDASRVVGYGAFAISAAPRIRMAGEEGFEPSIP